jgi:hypothetical protein
MYRTGRTRPTGRRQLLEATGNNSKTRRRGVPGAGRSACGLFALCRHLPDRRHRSGQPCGRAGALPWLRTLRGGLPDGGDHGAGCDTVAGCRHRMRACRRTRSCRRGEPGGMPRRPVGSRLARGRRGAGQRRPADRPGLVRVLPGRGRSCAVGSGGGGREQGARVAVAAPMSLPERLEDRGAARRGLLRRMAAPALPAMPRRVRVPIAPRAAQRRHAAIVRLAGQAAYDYRNCNYILMFGCGFLEAFRPYNNNMQIWGHIRGRKTPKTRVTAVDVHVNTTLAASDRGLLIRPGTDGALALAIAHVILTEGLWEKSFVGDFADGAEPLRGRSDRHRSGDARRSRMPKPARWSRRLPGRGFRSQMDARPRRLVEHRTEGPHGRMGGASDRHSRPRHSSAVRARIRLDPAGDGDFRARRARPHQRHLQRDGDPFAERAGWAHSLPRAA